ncbi:MAG: DUF512 domain-containing protein [Ruminococcaceae bacterium]|nr:DUF512 domain-containing protein [Oscillospiraceae bacterium]
MRYHAEVFRVLPDSIASELGICPGDVVCTINGRRVADFLDYQFLTASKNILLKIQKKDGQIMEFDIENEEMEDLGICFENMLFDPAKSCSNRCVFCFIDQLPPHLRQTLYFKDDDSRLSFLYGNYVTMTNMLPKDIDRLIEYRISPVNISVHTTNAKLREKMLRNRHAGRVLDYIQRLADGDIQMHMQIVLCKGLNDGEELNRTLNDLAAFHPAAVSVSVVPVGLTRYREGLYSLEPFTSADAKKVVEQVERLQQKFLQTIGTRFVYLGDEFYLLAEIPLPNADSYEGFPQIENGVGMETSMEEEFMQALEENLPMGAPGKTIIATGTLAYPFIDKLTALAKTRYPALDVEVVPVTNELFGGGVTVAGLLGGRDLLSALQGKSMDRLLLTSSMLKADEPIFLDDVTVCEVEDILHTRIVTNDNNGEAFLRSLLDCENNGV